jgi:hypothetical protein
MTMVVGLPISPAVAVSVAIAIPVSIAMTHSMAVADSPGSESRRRKIQGAIRKKVKKCTVAARVPAAKSVHQGCDPQSKNRRGDRQDYSAPNAALKPVSPALPDPPHRTTAPKLP